MENKTALQQAFSDLDEMYPHLFNEFSQEGRDFVYHFHKYLEVEKQQIMDAFEDGQSELSLKDKEQYYNETFGNEPT